MKTFQIAACNPGDISENFQQQQIVLYRKQIICDEENISSQIEKYVDLSEQEFLQTRPMHQNKNSYNSNKSGASHKMLLAVQMSHFEKKSRKCACPKCPVLKSSYCNIEYMPDGNAKPIDGFCPCCRNADNHGDEQTEDEREEECPTAQPYLQMLHDEERSIQAAKSEEEDTALRRIPCAGKNCPARHSSLCSVKTTTLTLGEVELECPCDNVCFILDCVNCNPKAAQQSTSGLRVSQSKRPKKRRHTTSKEMYSAYAVQQQDNGNISDGSPVLVHRKKTTIPVVPHLKEMYSAYAVQQQDNGNVSEGSS